jgi:hypothetical protein
MSEVVPTSFRFPETKSAHRFFPHINLLKVVVVVAKKKQMDEQNSRLAQGLHPAKNEMGFTTQIRTRRWFVIKESNGWWAIIEEFRIQSLNLGQQW